MRHPEWNERAVAVRDVRESDSTRGTSEAATAKGCATPSPSLTKRPSTADSTRKFDSGRRLQMVDTQTRLCVSLLESRKTVPEPHSGHRAQGCTLTCWLGGLARRATFGAGSVSTPHQQCNPHWPTSTLAGPLSPPPSPMTRFSLLKALLAAIHKHDRMHT